MYSLIYVLLVSRNNYNKLRISISLFLIINLLYYRYITFIEMIIGAALGILFAQLMYYLASMYIKGDVQSKEDDNAPK